MVLAEPIPTRNEGLMHESIPGRPPPFSLVAPLGTAGIPKPWEGRSAKKPWDFKATAIVPHLNTLELLEALVDLLRLQSQAPYLVIVDSGSPHSVCERLESLRSDDLEVHYLRGNAYTHSSEPVCVALDFGMSRVNTELIFLTHTDCFPMRQDALAWLGDQCSAATPVVGWEMSERSWATSEWQGLVSHTFTMLHAPTMRRIGATWHMQNGRDHYGFSRDYAINGWPDTETGFAVALAKAGIRPKLLGQEENYKRQTTEWWDHARSITGSKLYVGKGTADHVRYESSASAALQDAIARARVWKGLRPVQQPAWPA
jgi:hypothetical protein